MIVTISGLPGAGDTTVSRLVADKLGYKLVTVGEMFKELAKTHGFENKDLSGFWKTEEGSSESTHHELDDMQKEAVKNEKDLILNGRMAAFLIQEIELKIFLTASLDVRAKRVAQRDNAAVEHIQEEIEKRAEIERSSWKKMYGFDYAADLQAYDVIINTEHWSAEKIAEFIEEMITKKR